MKRPKATCCCYCNIDAGISCICCLDVLAIMIYGGILGFGVYIKLLIDPYLDGANGAAHDLDGSIIGSLLSTFGDRARAGYAVDNIKEELVASINCMIAFGVIGIVLVFLPRYISFITMKCKPSSDIRARKILYCIRLTSHLIQIFLMLGVFITLIILGYQSFFKFMLYINAPTLIIIGLTFSCVLCCESYYVCVAKRFLNEAVNTTQYDKA